ncbi:MAG: glycosyltransferase family 2 protein [Chloroflexi bacterium]|nr:glycosyltransferase family 2 protein [Chloroflexota bacterium]
MKTGPVVVVIVNWNTAGPLADCLRSVYCHSGHHDLEVIVVDNASSDNSVDIVQKLFPRVRMIANRENVGFSRANNQAISQSRRQYVMLLNPDTVFQNDVVGLFIRVFESDSRIAVVGPKLLTADGLLQRWTRGRGLTLRTATNHYLFLSRLFRRTGLFAGLDDDHNYTSMTDVDWVSGACLAIRRSTLEEVGLLDESMFMYYEDVEFCHRVRRSHYRVVTCPAAEVTHLEGQAMRKQRSWQVLAGPIFSQDLLYCKLYGEEHLHTTLFRSCLGTFGRWLGMLLQYALWRTSDAGRRAYQQRLFLKAAWHLLRSGAGSGRSP